MPMKHSEKPTAISELPAVTPYWIIFTDESHQEGGDEYSSGHRVDTLGVNVLTEPERVQHEVERRTKLGLRFRCFKVSGEVKAEIKVQVNVE